MNCLKCKYFDPLHFECNDERYGILCEEMEAGHCLEDKTCSSGCSDHSKDYWIQRATNAEAYIESLEDINEVEANRNALPKRICAR